MGSPTPSSPPFSVPGPIVRFSALSILRPLLAALLFLAWAGSTAHARLMIGVDDPSWRLESSSDGISLYRGSVKGSGVVPVKVVMSIPGTIEEVSLVLEDIPRRPQWIGNRTESVLLERTSDYDQTEYLKVDMPWPAADRSALIRAQIDVGLGGRRATIKAESIDEHPADTLARLVRATVHTSVFEMTQKEDHVDVVALVFIDPRGSIPKWIVNYFARKVARGTLSGLRRQVAKHLYSPAQVAGMRRRIFAFPALSEHRPGTP